MSKRYAVVDKTLKVKDIYCEHDDLGWDISTYNLCLHGERSILSVFVTDDIISFMQDRNILFIGKDFQILQHPAFDERGFIFDEFNVGFEKDGDVIEFKIKELKGIGEVSFVVTYMEELKSKWLVG